MYQWRDVDLEFFSHGQDNLLYQEDNGVLYGESRTPELLPEIIYTENIITVTALGSSHVGAMVSFLGRDSLLSGNWSSTFTPL